MGRCVVCSACVIGEVHWENYCSISFHIEWDMIVYSDSIPFDFDTNRISFGSKSIGKLSLRSYPIQCEKKWNHSFLSVCLRIRVRPPRLMTHSTDLICEQLLSIKPSLTKANQKIVTTLEKLFADIKEKLFHDLQDKFHQMIVTLKEECTTVCNLKN